MSAAVAVRGGRQDTSQSTSRQTQMQRSNQREQQQQQWQEAREISVLLRCCVWSCWSCWRWRLVLAWALLPAATLTDRNGGFADSVKLASGTVVGRRDGDGSLASNAVMQQRASGDEGCTGARTRTRTDYLSAAEESP
ncbi:hypothetical protein IQ07DRAFT_428615 [Pyrenochaeta sp. DS3sAY3a]|nr:hypothetical protein IQ07DRAFT_428615 [Pyrenochaeta sp. DS3sAY3a]